MTDDYLGRGQANLGRMYVGQLGPPGDNSVAVHVANILLELGRSSRAEVAAWAVRHDVVQQPG